MRPGFLFLGLFAVLTATYVLSEGTLGSWMTFALQAAIVVALLAAAMWRRSWRAGREAAASGATLDAQAETEDPPPVPEDSEMQAGSSGRY